nr:flap endonuclease gen like 1 [Quercus suber]
MPFGPSHVAGGSVERYAAFLAATWSSSGPAAAFRGGNNASNLRKLELFICRYAAGQPQGGVNMGITGLWEALGDGEICSIADYAARFFETHKRPLRIAVDEACWRFTNLTDEQVQAIRDGEPSANPIEKTILWRVLRLMKLNIQLLFVYDGPRRPWKRGKRGGSRVNFELTRLLHKMLDHLKIAHHQAPGEAEAECAKLNQLGIVDAVWSDDGDAFMFGCQTLIKQHKVGGKIVTSRTNEGPLGMVKVFTIDYLRETHDLDADSLVLFAMLAGGDYDSTGLRGCGTRTASLVARRQCGVASALCHVSKQQLPIWREHLAETIFAVCGRAVEVPYTFPDWKALEHYRNPSLSTEEQLFTLRGLRKGWDVPMVLFDLRVFLRERFHFGTREFLKHISPIFMVRALARATPEQRRENLKYKIELKRTRTVKPKDDEDPPVKPEVKITYSPLYNFQIDLSRPPEEDWSKWMGKDGTPYDPTQDLDFEILDCFLRHGLAADEYPIEAIRTPRKRKASTATPSSSMRSDDTVTPSQRKQAKSSQGDCPASSMPDIGVPENLCNMQKASTSTPPRANAAPLSSAPSSQSRGDMTPSERGVGDAVVTTAEGTTATASHSAPKPKFKIPRVITSALLDAAIASSSQSPRAVIDLDDPDQDMTILAPKHVAPAYAHLNDPGTRSKIPMTSIPAVPDTPASKSTDTPLSSPGAVIDPATLRELRQNSSLLGETSTSRKVSRPRRWNPPPSEVIDLT